MGYSGEVEIEPVVVASSSSSQAAWGEIEPLEAKNVDRAVPPEAVALLPVVPDLPGEVLRLKPREKPS